MKTKSLIALLFFSFLGSANAELRLQDKLVDLDHIELALQNEVGEDQTCVDEFIVREKYLKKFLLFAPPIGMVATPVAGYAGGMAAAALSGAAGVSGWSALGWTILGAFGAGGGALGALVFLEVDKGIEFSNNRYMIRLVSAAHLRDMENEKIKNFLGRYRNKYEQDSHLSDEDIIEELAMLDESGALCDGTVTGKTGKFRKKLSRRRHALRYIHKTLGQL